MLPDRVKVKTVSELLAVTVELMVIQEPDEVFCKYTVPVQVPYWSAVMLLVLMASLKVTTTEVVVAETELTGVTLETVGAVVSLVETVVNPVVWVVSEARATPAEDLASVVTLTL